MLDVIGAYYFYKRFALFANLNNIGDAPSDLESYGPSTPTQAQFRQRIDDGSLGTLGIKVTFSAYLPANRSCDERERADHPDATRSRSQPH
jgi:hypothetical protein